MNMEKNPNPTKDQHFMIDKNMLELIYDTADVQEGESIVEIGGGSGALTDYLVQGKNYVTVIEKDPYYANLLKKKYSSYPNVRIIEGDALNFNFNDYDRIVANLPYTITEPFLINLASSGALDYNPVDLKSSKIKSITLVLSQNSTRKMVAPIQITEGNSRHANQEFGFMSVICKAFCDTNVVCAIPSEAFYPEPAVTSFVVNLTPKKEKTTVDRILREMLICKNGRKPSVKRVYELMIVQGKVYKASKHKNNTLSISSTNKFTSKNIEDKNIYDLKNMQVSQLVQDLIRNDINIKSRNQRSRTHIDYDDVSRYFVNGRFNYDYEDDYLDEEEEFIPKSKFEKKYDYMYDSTIYDVLMSRGLEYIDSSELQMMFTNERNTNKGRILHR